MTGQELDLLELGYDPTRVQLGIDPTRCLKGENGPRGAQIVAGRAARGIAQARRQRLYREHGKKLPWAEFVETQAQEEIEGRIRKLEREKEAAIRSLREYHDRRESERRRLVRRLVAMEKEKGHLKATIRILASDD
jgi:hypothetical protein